jgi:hypothetical protein
LKDNSVNLASGSGSVAAAVWGTSQLDIKGFEIYFDFQLPASTNGQIGEGFALVVQNSEYGISSIGGTGGKLGYGSHDFKDFPSWAVEFDSKQTSENKDPASNHISIHTRGPTTAASASEEFNIGYYTFDSNTTLADGQVHRILLKHYDNITDIYYDTYTKPLFSVPGLVRQLLDSETAYVGFTSANSASTVGDQFIVNFQAGGGCDTSSLCNSPCPNGCSSHGICDLDAGICTCDVYYSGLDCSQEQTVNPIAVLFFLLLAVGMLFVYFSVCCVVKFPVAPLKACGERKSRKRKYASMTLSSPDAVNTVAQSADGDDLVGLGDPDGVEALQGEECGIPADVLAAAILQEDRMLEAERMQATSQSNAALRDKVSDLHLSDVEELGAEEAMGMGLAAAVVAEKEKEKPKEKEKEKRERKDRGDKPPKSSRSTGSAVEGGKVKTPRAAVEEEGEESAEARAERKEKERRKRARMRRSERSTRRTMADIEG